MPMEIITKTRLVSILALARELKVADNWDVIIHGDGSGSGWDLPIGWGAVLVDRHARGRMQFCGGMSTGTVNIAELTPFTQAMAWYSERRKRVIANGGAIKAICNVHLVTDHAAIQLDGTALTRGGKSVRDVNANRPEWAKLLAYEWEGFAFTFHWIPRSSTALNVWCDDQSKICFKAMKEMRRPATPDGREVSIYDCNADHEDATALHFVKPLQPRGQRRKHARRERGCPAETDE